MDLDRISYSLKGRARRALPDASRGRAAVMVALYGPGPDYRVLYTVRTHKVEHHKGEISFPGGARDPEDESVVHTALRESWEEIGVEMGHFRVLGLMDDTVTRSSFTVTPVVGRLDRHPYEFMPHPDEVETILEVPLSHLADPANLVLGHIGPMGAPMPTPSYRFREHVIFGATASMTRAFLGLVLGNETRITTDEHR